MSTVCVSHVKYIQSQQRPDTGCLYLLGLQFIHVDCTKWLVDGEIEITLWHVNEGYFPVTETGRAKWALWFSITSHPLILETKQDIDRKAIPFCQFNQLSVAVLAKPSIECTESPSFISFRVNTRLKQNCKLIWQWFKFSCLSCFMCQRKNIDLFFYSCLFLRF